MEEEVSRGCEVNKVLCDQCESDLSTTGNCVAWSITLKNRQIPCHSAAVTDMMIYPQLKKDLDFCGLACLKKWIANT